MTPPIHVDLAQHSIKWVGGAVSHNLLTHLPLEFLIIPPPIARPRFPKEEPLALSLNQFSGGRSHLTRMLEKLRLGLPLMLRKAYSVALANVPASSGL